MVKTESPRLECFQRTLECVECKVVGNVFLLQTTIDNGPKLRINCHISDCQWCGLYKRLQIQRLQHHLKSDTVVYNTPHLNLFSRQSDGRMILMTKDHIMPKARGGSDSLSNLQTMCEHCNCRKGSMHPDEYAKRLINSQRVDGGSPDGQGLSEVPVFTDEFCCHIARAS